MLQHRKGSVFPHMIAGREISAKVSTTVEDAEWDTFLQSTPLGHFQQSSLWAQAKLGEGWKPIRFILNVDGLIAGGFQILTRQSRLGKIGYVSKGPVITCEEPAFLEFLFEQLVTITKRNQLRALIVQPPDEREWNGAVLARYHFVPNHLVSVVSATLLVDLSGGMPDIEKRMRKNRLTEVRQARRRGITIREGDEKDVGVFFSLMASTCQRQRTQPVPSTEASLRAFWRAFYPKGRLRLSLAECEGEPVSGMLCFQFGQRVTVWKKGWSGKYSDRYPNSLITFEAIEWAHLAGGALFDFAAMSPEIAKGMISGSSTKEQWKSSPDWFHLGFGNLPKLLPESRIYISNPLARFLYQRVGMARGLMRSLKAGKSSVSSV
jgi:lipid II:glycine glycyltransferase (peptidoglycan interpeptide bridge formation enzyme)